MTGETSGRTFGTSYFVDPANIGKLTTTPPTTPGQVNTFVGIAISTSELQVEITNPILL